MLVEGGVYSLDCTNTATDADRRPDPAQFRAALSERASVLGKWEPALQPIGSVSSKVGVKDCSQGALRFSIIAAWRILNRDQKL